MTCKRVMVSLSCSVCFLTSFANASVVYQSDFEQQGPGPEWLGASLTMTPAGCIRCTSFLGEFGNQFVTLDLGGLPAHLT
ncbi:MAG TPA: hypothetical protein VFA40_04845, partial [Terriglobales bacterium]|nr:hypothetical protein [Terriglobales bacterium]